MRGGRGLHVASGAWTLGGRTTPTQLKLVPSGRIYWAQGQLTRHLMSRVSISETVEGRWFDLVAIYGGLMWLC